MPRVLLSIGFALLVLAGGCSPPGLTAVELSVLVDEQDAWHGRDVEVVGVVRTFTPPRHYWVEDAAQNRVELLPHDGLAELVGQTVTVRGRFTFRDDEGRRIAIDELFTAATPVSSGRAST